MNKIKLGITLGDVNGIGPEVVIKSLAEATMLKYFTPVVYGHTKVLAHYLKLMELRSLDYMAVSNIKSVAEGKINVVNCWDEETQFELGKATKQSGQYAFSALEKATEDLKAGHIDGLVTAPINKHSMHLADFPYPGHTEYLTDRLEGPSSLMMMCSDDLRVALVTNHLSIAEVATSVTKQAIQTKLKTLYTSLVEDFGVEKPVIAVLGLNPHAGDDGVIGSEEDDFIKPLVMDAKKQGKLVMGPYAADGFFGSTQFTKVDAILAMYHDQGLAPFKALSFGKGVNLTAGLKYVRTSPDHGTGYDIVGQGKADPSSMRAAIHLAIDTIRCRTQYHADRENKLQPTDRSRSKRER
jgi:4-hydroxythreonine-4-phosphate dehydrogenase